MTTDDTERTPKVIRCEHWSEELGRSGGWHHHEGPNACDSGNHGGECPYLEMRRWSAEPVIAPRGSADS